ncbi:MAG: TolC family protein, partial [Pseudomonadota bacterium]
MIHAAYSQYRNIEHEILLKAIKAHVNVVRDRLFLDLRSKSEAMFLQELEAAKERRKFGEFTLTDVAQAQSRYARAKSSTISARDSLDVSLTNFEDVFGIHAPKNLEFPELGFKTPTSLEHAIEISIVQNADIRKAEDQYAAAENLKKSIKRELYPEISAFASHNQQYDPQPGIVDQSQTQMVGLKASINLYQGGAVRSRIREAKKTAYEQKMKIQEIIQSKTAETSRRYKAITYTKNLIKNREAEANATRTAFEGVREESLLGQRDLLDVLDAQQDMIDAEVSYISAVADE